MGTSDKEEELLKLIVTPWKSEQEANHVCMRFLWRARNLFLSAQDKLSWN